MDVAACTTRVCQCLYHYTIPEIATLRRVLCSNGFRRNLEGEAAQRGSCRGVCINHPCKEGSRRRGSHRYDPRSRTTRTSPRRLASLRKHPKTVKLILPCTHPENSIKMFTQVYHSGTLWKTDESKSIASSE
jgi:hypothetical protein